MRVLQDKEPCVRPARVRTVSPISVDKGLEGVGGLLLEVKTPVHCPLKKTKDLHGGGVVSEARVLQKLREFADGKRDVRAS
jgi:hypothetical protein